MARGGYSFAYLHCPQAWQVSRRKPSAARFADRYAPSAGLSACTTVPFATGRPSRSLARPIPCFLHQSAPRFSRSASTKASTINISAVGAGNAASSAVRKEAPVSLSPSPCLYPRHVRELDTSNREMGDSPRSGARFSSHTSQIAQASPARAALSPQAHRTRSVWKKTAYPFKSGDHSQ